MGQQKKESICMDSICSFGKPTQLTKPHIFCADHIIWTFLITFKWKILIFKNWNVSEGKKGLTNLSWLTSFSCEYHKNKLINRLVVWISIVKNLPVQAGQPVLFLIYSNFEISLLFSKKWIQMRSQIYIISCISVIKQCLNNVLEF